MTSLRSPEDSGHCLRGPWRTPGPKQQRACSAPAPAAPSCHQDGAPARQAQGTAGVACAQEQQPEQAKARNARGGDCRRSQGSLAPARGCPGQRRGRPAGPCPRLSPAGTQGPWAGHGRLSHSQTHRHAWHQPKAVRAERSPVVPDLRCCGPSQSRELGCRGAGTGHPLPNWDQLPAPPHPTPPRRQGRPSLQAWTARGFPLCPPLLPYWKKKRGQSSRAEEGGRQRWRPPASLSHVLGSAQTFRAAAAAAPGDTPLSLPATALGSQSPRAPRAGSVTASEP